MRRDDPTFRMRREQLGELVALTSQSPAPRRTAEMPPVEIMDLLRRDRELDAAPAVIAGRAPAVETVRIRGPSRAGLALGCAAAFLGGLALTLPLWW